MAKATNIFLLGKTGSGKSSLGNALLGGSKQHFAVSSGMFSAEASGKCQSAESGGLTVVDTPDILGYHQSPTNYRKSLSKAFDLVNGEEFHAFLILIRLDVRFTDEEYSVIKILRELFGQQVLQFSIVAFTHCDSFLSDDEVMKQLEQNRSELAHFDKLLSDCENRFCILGKDKRQESMKALRDQIVNLQKTRGSDAYKRTEFETGRTINTVRQSTMSSRRSTACDII